MKISYGIKAILELLFCLCFNISILYIYGEYICYIL